MGGILGNSILGILLIRDQYLLFLIIKVMEIGGLGGSRGSMNVEGFLGSGWDGDKSVV